MYQGRKKGNFQGGARSANFGGSGGIFSNMAPHKSIFRAIEGGRRVCQGGAPDHFGMPGGGARPRAPPLFAPLLYMYMCFINMLKLRHNG